MIQTYVQIVLNLNRSFYIKSFYEFVTIMKTSFDCILKIMKSLYDVFKRKNHWFFIYHKFHTKKLDMIKSTYDSCLLHCIKSFVIIDFQIDDILIFVSDDFAIKKNEIIKTINIIIKKRECLITTNSIKFNDMKIKFDENKIINMKYKGFSPFWFPLSAPTGKMPLEGTVLSSCLIGSYARCIWFFWAASINHIYNSHKKTFNIW